MEGGGGGEKRRGEIHTPERRVGTVTVDTGGRSENKVLNLELLGQLYYYYLREIKKREKNVSPDKNDFVQHKYRNIIIKTKIKTHHDT